MSRTRPDPDRAALQQGIRRLATVGLVGYAAFAMLDVLLELTLYPDAPRAWIGAGRGLGVVTIATWAWWARRGAPTVRAMVVATAICYAVSGALVGGMAAHFGGLDSIYVAGVAFYYVGTAALLPSPWRRCLAMLLPLQLATFAGQLVVVAASARWSGQFAERAPVIHAMVNGLFTAGLLAFSVGISHLLWVSRRQLFEARRLGRYRLTSPIGAGGMNEVWLARDSALGRDVALKILRAVPGASDDRWLRFEREAQVASTLSSPHSIKIFDYGASDDGIAYIAMEYLRGADLDYLVGGWGPLAVGRTLHFARQACLSLADAHQRGLVHRDVKPGNLFALASSGDEDFLKVLDFGVVRASGPAMVTREGTTVGTPEFMAPEQFLGGDVSPASDVYALGATIYFMLTGVPPFDVVGDATLWRAHASAPVVPIGRRRGHEVPMDLEAIVSRCLAKHPVDRFRDAAALGAALDAITEIPPWTPADARAAWAETRTRAPYRREGRGAAVTTPAHPTTAPGRRQEA
ncbi:MAG: serine/threonine protein kinase [Deltaproteobacteria bacterium]|nr:serine/threonine protein kinase [Deltaproteobacteria bacterium]